MPRCSRRDATEESWRNERMPRPPPEPGRGEVKDMGPPGWGRSVVVRGGVAPAGGRGRVDRSREDDSESNSQ
ncbi:hypothetical protein CCE02nite_03650 [Cellulosimicrobium cellulans]|uniref:Uncharacterized protein n=1 Tax=Cellulosimicrobium cellulans TaxID=1710 RepID=A0A4Y4DTS8_CELCE|nr:hypothetical protein CCE02nite_03650 [Cellulosimicrobium cellulans]